MKKAFLIFGALLIALAVVAPGPPEKAEKVRIDTQGWDVQPFFHSNSDGTFTWGVNLDGIEVKYGLATAGEHAEFTLGVTLSGVMIDSNGWDLDWDQTLQVGFSRDPDGGRDADGYIRVLADPVAWNGDDDGAGYIIDRVSLTLVGPSGAPMGEPSAADVGRVLIAGSSFNTPVMIDDQDWDYDPEHSAVVVPLLAASGHLSEMQRLALRVTLDVEVWNLDGSFAGSGRGSGGIIGIDDSDRDYVRIQPVLATLDEGLSWNGDDDGSGIVTGLIDLVDPAGNAVSRATFTDQTVGFMIHGMPEPCPGCDAP
jgi:hypothetical protein